MRSASTRRRPRSSSESTSSRSSSGGDGSRAASASSSERTARRCSPCEPKLRRSRSPLAISTSSRCGPSPVAPRSTSRGEARLERLERRRGSGVAEPCVLEAELACALRELRGERVERCAARCDEVGPERGDLLGPRCERCAIGLPELHTPQRGVPLGERREILLGDVGPGREEPSESAVEVRTPRSRAALDDGQPVGREHERRDLAAQRLGRREARAVQPRLLRLALTQRHRDRHGRRHPPSLDLHAARRLAEADQLRIVSRARREALRRDVQRLEQVRLAGTVTADDEHDAGVEPELE